MEYGHAVRRCVKCEFDCWQASLDDKAFLRKVYEGVVIELERAAAHFPSAPCRYQVSGEAHG